MISFCSYSCANQRIETKNCTDGFWKIECPVPAHFFRYAFGVLRLIKTFFFLVDSHGNFCILVVMQSSTPCVRSTYYITIYNRSNGIYTNELSQFNGIFYLFSDFICFCSLSVYSLLHNQNILRIVVIAIDGYYSLI